MIFGTGKNRAGVFRGKDVFEMIKVYHTVLGKEEEPSGFLVSDENTVAKRLRTVVKNSNNFDPKEQDHTWNRIFGGEEYRSQWIDLNLV